MAKVSKTDNMKDIKQLTTIFLERFNTLGQSGFYAHPDEIKILGNYLNKVGNDMGVDDNYELLGLFAGSYAHMKMLKEFSEWTDKL